MGLMGMIAPAQMSDIRAGRAIRPFAVQPGSGGNGGRGGTVDPPCDANASNTPCIDTGSGMIVLATVQSNSIGLNIDLGGSYNGLGAVYLPHVPNVPDTLPPIFRLSCYAGVLADALAAAAAIGQQLWQAVEDATGGKVSIGDFGAAAGWTAADILELAGAAIGALGLGGWIVIIIGVLALVGIVYSASQCPKP